MLGCDNTVIEAVDWLEDAGDGAGRRLRVVVHVRPRARQAGRCGICGSEAVDLMLGEDEVNHPVSPAATDSDPVPAGAWAEFGD